VIEELIRNPRLMTGEAVSPDDHFWHFFPAIRQLFVSKGSWKLAGSMSSEEEDFETPQYRIASISTAQRHAHLQSPKLVFGIPPRTDSLSCLDAQTISAHLSRSNSSAPSPILHASETFHDFLSDDEPPESDLDVGSIHAKLHSFIEDCPAYLSLAVDHLISGRNQIFVDILTKQDFVPLSSILQVHKHLKALIICPSNRLIQWVRSFLVDSNALCPEKRSDQQAALSKLASSRTQVLLCLANRFSTLSITHFQFVYVVKSELCRSVLPGLVLFPGAVLLHASPGYSIDPPFACVTTKGDLTVKCRPQSVFDPNYLSRLPTIVSNEEATCVIAPFKANADEAFRQIAGQAVKYSPEWRETDPRVCVGTIAILYTPALFNHYIFVDFPPSFEHLLMACHCGTKVTVLVNVATAGKLQALSHTRGIDRNIVNKVIQTLLWNRTDYRNAGEITGISLSRFDLPRDAFEDFVIELIREGLVVSIPFHFQTVTIRIHNVTVSMKGSRLIDAVLQRTVKARGHYIIRLLELCQDLQMSPLDIDCELERYAAQKWIEFSYTEELEFFQIRRKIEDDDQFGEAVLKLAKMMAKREEDADHSFDIMFTLMKNPAEMDRILETGEPEVLIPIPRSGINISEIKRMLSIHKRAEWTPRAVARVLHGIGSPKFDANEWMRTPFWGKQTMASFKEIMWFCQQVMCNPAKIPDT
jgi:hypothetical protein